MASQTIKKSSPDASTDGFQPLSFERATSEEGGAPQAAVRPDLSAFTLSSDCWGALLADPTLRAEWERALEEKVRERLGADNASYRATLVEEARNQGRREGIADARAEIHGLADKLDRICREILQAKEAVLHAHEKEWAESLVHLLRRFLVRRPQIIAERLEAWLSESVEGFAGKQVLRVHLSSSEYDEMKKISGEETRRQFVLVRDVALAPGEVHAECEGGGFFFSPAKEAERLNAILAEFFTGEGSHEL